MAEIVVVSPQNRDVQVICNALEAAHYSVRHFSGMDEAMAYINSAIPGVAILDASFADNHGGELLHQALGRLSNAGVEVVIMGEYSRSLAAANALRHGAYDFLPRPVDAQEARAAIDRIFDDGNGDHPEKEEVFEQVAFEGRDGLLIIRQPQYFEHGAAMNLISLIDGGLDVPRKGLIIDMADTRQICSAGIGVLHLLAHHCDPIRRSLYIVSPQPRIEELIALAGVFHFYKRANGIDEAIADLGEGPA